MSTRNPQTLSTSANCPQKFDPRRGQNLDVPGLPGLLEISFCLVVLVVVESSGAKTEFLPAPRQHTTLHFFAE